MSRGYSAKKTKVDPNGLWYEETIIVGPGFVTNMMENAVEWPEGRQEFAVRRSIVGVSGYLPRPMPERIISKNIRPDGDMSKLVVRYKQGDMVISEFILRHGDVETKRLPDGTIVLLCSLCGKRMDVPEKYILPVPGWLGIIESIKGCSANVLTEEIYATKDIDYNERLPRENEDEVDRETDVHEPDSESGAGGATVEGGGKPAAT